MSGDQESVRSQLWEEIPEPDNPFAAAACFCAGFDVYGDVLKKAGLSEYLHLLFTGERPTPSRAQLLERLAIVLANPGPRDHSVRAAMAAGAGGSTHAACLMAALGVGAGQLGGAHEVALAMELRRECATDLQRWQERLEDRDREERADVWPAIEHAPGFDPHGASCATPVRQALQALAECGAPNLQWLERNREALEEAAGAPLGLTGVAAASLCDLGLDPEQGEMLYLVLRLPGAAAHALEQRRYGWRAYPFFRNGLTLLDDPIGRADSSS